MSFFDSVSEKFFNPFCCRNRAVYFECITQLIEKSKEIPVLYEADARNTLILYLQNCQYSLETENIGEEIGNARTPQENASAILRYFRVCGWITPQEIGRSGDNIASVSAYCRKLIDADFRTGQGKFVMKFCSCVVCYAYFTVTAHCSTSEYLLFDEIFLVTSWIITSVKCNVNSYNKKYTGCCYRSARSVYLLHRPYENAESAGIRLITKRFPMVGCRYSSPG